MTASPSPLFAAFAPPIRTPTASRAAITAATRAPEVDCVAALVAQATVPEAVRARAQATARALIEGLRARPAKGGVQALVQEYALSSQEGVALMCLAEALLRIPDTATRDALIRDKIAGGDWAAHLGDGRSLFLNAATWGLVVTGKLAASADDRGLSAALTRAVARLGEPVIRRGVDIAMRMMGEQFVTGQTIEEALKRSRPLEAKGYRYSYDMLGEAATTAADAARYLGDYERAIHAIGRASAGRGVVEGPGISIKLSALHPRYARAQAGRVMAELLPRVHQLCRLAKSYDIGLNIDAEEADRLEISLDLLEALAGADDLAGWNGLGFVIQAYGKRCPFVIDHVVALARATGRRIMVRLVKGAYWDAEIKRAQVDGLAGFPVFTRKVHTDVSYLACARKLLDARDAVFPQFATHNAQTLATIHAMAGPDFILGDYEYQCLHGMGEPLYDQVVGQEGLNRPCRIYAPVGTHETLLAYLVRRLLENGANSSFVNRIGDPAVPIEALIADPVEEAREGGGAPHAAIALPGDIFGERVNSAGIDLADEAALAALGKALRESAAGEWVSKPLPFRGGVGVGPFRKDTGQPDAPTPNPSPEGEGPKAVLNPADHRDQVGTVMEVSEQSARQAATRAAAAQPGWAATPVDQRAAMLERAADLMQAAMPQLIGLAIREAGKSAANAVAEVREAIDFLRYYAAEARRTIGPAQTPLGPVVCISPWNFPLAIFTGQVAAALVAGNTVLAKPAEETPLIAAEGVRLLHEAGIPEDVLHFLPGDGAIGAALVAAPETQGVMFTGSTEVARLIQRQLSTRTAPDGHPIPLIAETGGQNAMIVDSSALAEQVAADVLVSAFDSAGQRCSALRLLCLQEEVADRILTMIKGAMAELSVGRTDALAVDIGPVITPEAQAGIVDHIAAMIAGGHKVHQLPLDEDATAHGSFVPPTIIEIGAVAELTREVFGPVLHVLRYRADKLDALVDAINATGYGLTFGLHTRLDETIARLTRRIGAGNLYVNRTVIGAVVGLQPFGGRGLSGTGPKAGGPLYLGRLVRDPQPAAGGALDPALTAYGEWLKRWGEHDVARRVAALPSPLGHAIELPGPVGERNLYALHPRGPVALWPARREGLWVQLGAALATGNIAIVPETKCDRDWLAGLPAQVEARIRWSADALAEPDLAAVLVEDRRAVPAVARAVAARDGAIVPVHLAAAGGYALDRLVEEVSTSINTTAAGGNASLMTIS